MLYFFLGAFFFLLYNVRTQDGSCYNSSEKIGVCVLISECSSMVKILKSAGQNQFSPQYINAVELLRASICGLDGIKPKVCCELPDVLSHQNLRLLDHTSCGTFSTDKIFGGSKTGIFEFPWMALIIYQIRNSGIMEFHCGGTIINKRYILTAAHCVTAVPSNFILRRVRVGDHDLNTIKDCDTYYNNKTQSYQQECTEGFQEFDIENIHVHPEFSTRTYHNDIALLRLNSDIIFVPQNVRPICLPIGSAAKFYGNKGIVTGWGSTEFGPQSSELLKVKIPLVSNAECVAKYSQQNITYTQICAGGETGLDSCSGDSGGPLQNPGNYYTNSRFIQYGIVSLGRKLCGIRGYPAIYTSVRYYVNWILNTMRE